MDLSKRQWLDLGLSLSYRCVRIHMGVDIKEPLSERIST